MNALLDLEQKLRTTSSALGRLEQAFAKNPSRGMQANILSLRKLHANLQGEFKEVADTVGVDVCQYRLLNDRPSLLALTGALSTFQQAFSQVFEAIHEKRRRDRRGISRASELLSTLEVAYSFPGSFGLALTIPSPRMLFEEMPNEIDRTATAVLGVVKSHASPESVSSVIAQMGRAPIAAIYEWATVSAQYDAGAAIEWIRGDRTKASATVQTPEFAEVSKSLEVRSESKTDEIAVEGVLVGADIRTGRFHFVTSDTDESIRGTFTDAISETQQAKVPSRYRARMLKSTEIRLATNTESNVYFLESLEVLPQ